MSGKPPITKHPIAKILRPASGLLRRALLGPVPRLFDARYYLSRNPAVARQGLDPFLHYVWFGARAGLDPSEDFDTAFYRRQSGATRLDPVRHYLREGARAGLDPSAAFSTSLYLARYPDVLQAGTNPLLHYRLNGRAEGRESAPSPIESDRLRALDGVPPEHEHRFPAEPGGRFELKLLRQAPLASCTAFAPRLCLHLALDGLACDALLDAFRTLAEGPQDAITLRIDGAKPGQPPVATQLLAFERCYHGATEEGGLILRYAELKVWDLRRKTPVVTAILLGGSFSARSLGSSR